MRIFMNTSVRQYDGPAEIGSPDTSEMPLRIKGERGQVAIYLTAAEMLAIMAYGDSIGIAPDGTPGAAAEGEYLLTRPGGPSLRYPDSESAEAAAMAAARESGAPISVWRASARFVRMAPPVERIDLGGAL